MPVHPPSLSAARGRLRRWLTGIAIVLVVTLLTSIAENHLSMVHVAESWTADLRVASMTPSAPVSPSISVVMIDRETLRGLPYRSPLDRGMLADLITALDRKGPRAIGLDVIFTQPTEPAKDRRLRQVLETTRSPVVLASAAAPEGLSPDQVAFMDGYVDSLSTGLSTVYADAADGVVRAVLLRRGTGGVEQLGLAAALARATDHAVPPGEVLELVFRAGPRPGAAAFDVHRAHEIGAVPDERLADRIVLIGADLLFTDKHRTPLSSDAFDPGAAVPGVMLHAHALSQIVEGHGSPEVSGAVRGAVVLAAVVAGVALFSLELSLLAIVTLSSGVVLLGWVAGLYTFYSTGALVPLVAPTLGFGVAAALTVALRWRHEHGQRRFIHEAFEKYVSPAVINQLVREPSLLVPGGERREVTFVFTDVQGFSSMAERADAGDVLAVMNDYLDGAFRVILEHDGTINRVVGDEILVLFNAPARQQDHPERAVRCALALERYFTEFAERQAGLGRAFGRTRIGVHTGVVVIGNYGGSQHFEYSATGEAINVAARLEGANKHLGTWICVSGVTARRCKGIAHRPVASIVVKGRSDPIDVHEPLTDASPDPSAYRSAFALLDTDPEEARAAFSELAERFPDDSLVQLHDRRLTSGESGSMMVMDDK